MGDHLADHPMRQPATGNKTRLAQPARPIAMQDPRLLAHLAEPFALLAQ